MHGNSTFFLAILFFSISRGVALALAPTGLTHAQRSLAPVQRCYACVELVYDMGIFFKENGGTNTNHFVTEIIHCFMYRATEGTYVIFSSTRLEPHGRLVGDLYVVRLCVARRRLGGLKPGSGGRHVPKEVTLPRGPRKRWPHFPRVIGPATFGSKCPNSMASLFFRPR